MCPRCSKIEFYSEVERYNGGKSSWDTLKKMTLHDIFITTYSISCASSDNSLVFPAPKGGRGEGGVNMTVCPRCSKTEFYSEEFLHFGHCEKGSFNNLNYPLYLTSQHKEFLNFVLLKWEKTLIDLWLTTKEIRHLRQPGIVLFHFTPRAERENRS